MTACLAAPGAAASRAADVPAPGTHLGFRPGADGHLAPWGEVVSYFQKVDLASDRVKVRVLGETTEGRPFLAAFVSAAETIKDLDRYRGLQAKLSDPRLIPADADRPRVVAESKVVVVIACSIHSTETASTLMAMELLHGLASRDDPETREILDRTILILVPSVNPDGVEKVARWYERTKGHPWEGSGLPALYHTYAGHDTNRDWFMLNLKETRLLTRMLYKDWFPTLLYDVHQMGSRGARIFVPPFYDPINPNLDPRLNQGIFLIGAHMAADLAAAGRRGVLTNAMYDNWWNGGNRTTPQRHNIVAVLTESASVRLATPIFLEPADLKAEARGFISHQPAVNFVDPWPGGWWRLRDIVDDQLICARSLLTLAARCHDGFQSNLLALASASLAKGSGSPPFAWVVPRDQRDPGSAARLVGILHDSGIEVHSALEPFRADGVSFPAGSWILPAAQPYRPHLKDMMERQVYPNRLTAGGKAETPYDVAGWTLPLQMGVRVAELSTPPQARTAKLDRIEAPRGGIDAWTGPGRPDYYVIGNTTNDDFLVRNALVAAGVEVELVRIGTQAMPVGSLKFTAGEKARAVLDEVLQKVTTRVRAGQDPRPAAPGGSQPPSPPDPAGIVAARNTYSPKHRIGVYQPWMPSMDEGWTRLVLETFKVPYTTLHNSEIRAGGLRGFDVLLLPSIEAKVIRSGYAPNETEPAYVGGLGAEGAEELRRFVREGGRLVCLDASCEYAIEELNLPVKNVVKGLSTADFYAPGSILRAGVVDRDVSTTTGVADEVSVYFDQSQAFELVDTKDAAVGNRVAVRYARSRPLESGWLLGPSKLEGKAALVKVHSGGGTVILFGFPPQHRGQTHGTFRLLFNALMN